MTSRKKQPCPESRLEQALRRSAWCLLWVLPMCVGIAIAAVAAAESVDEGALQESFAATQTLGRGFDANKRFNLDKLDSVNTFNGNLIIRIPIGMTYTADGGQSYGLTLAYNSKLWDFESVVDPNNIDPAFSDCPGAMSEMAFPMRDANAGLGWKVSLGELYPPRVRRVSWDGRTPHPNPNKSDLSWLYVGPDGSQVQFVSKIHPAAGNDGIGSVQVYYSDDGGYRRLRINDAEGWAAVDDPSGATSWFERSCASCNLGAGEWRIRRLLDAADEEPRGQIGAEQCLDPTSLDGNVFVDYSIGRWSICDNLGRQHVVNFDAAFNVREIELEGFGGARLHYEFRYSSLDVAVPSGHSAPSEVAPRIYYDRAFLSEIWPPSPVTGSADEGRGFSFEYLDYVEDPANPIAYGSNDVKPAGYLTTMRLPTGGAYRYTYQVYTFPNPSEGPAPLGNRCSKGNTSVNTSAGIRTRTLEEAFTSFSSASAPVDPKSATWGYFPARLRRTDPSQNCVAFYPETQRIVLDPEGDIRVDYYNTVNGCESEFSDGEDSLYESQYGLPYSPIRWVDDVTIGQLYLESETYSACAAIPEDYNPADIDSTQVVDGQTYHPLPGTLCADKLVRSSYVRYDLLNVPVAGQWPEDCEDSPATCKAFRQKTASRILYPDGRSVTTRYQDWDGLGHFRQVATKGWAATGSESTIEAVVQRSYEVGGQSPVTNVQPPTSYPGAGEAWLLDRVRSETTTSDGDSHQRTYCYNSSGRLSGERIHAAAGVDGRRDLVNRFFYSEAGNILSERSYGGDLQELPGVAGCEQPGFHAEYRKDYTYEAGVQSSATIVDDSCAAGAAASLARCVLLTSFENTRIDTATGHVVESRNSAGLRSSAEYDVLGRLIEVREGGDAPRSIGYSDARVDLGFPATTSVTQGDAETRIFHSGLGRPFKMLTRIPGSDSTPIYSETRTQYFADGVVAGESTPVPEGEVPTNWLNYQFDALGRLTKRRGADWLLGPGGGSRNDSFMTYNGMNHVVEKFYIKNNLRPVDASGGEMFLRRKETFLDYQGRVGRVLEDLDDDGEAEVRTDYEYQGDGKISSVTQGGQLRLFRYDGRGFLFEEQHPEFAFNGRPVRVLHEYDSLGHVRVTNFIGSTGEVLRSISFHYDKIGRLVSSWDELAGRPLVENFYYGIGGAIGNAGNLALSRRHNWVANPAALGDPSLPTIRDVVITHTFEYDSTSGRLLRRGTRSSRGARFEMKMNYDPLGRLLGVSYPHCSRHSECEGVAILDRDVGFEYEAGEMKSVLADIWKNGSELSGEVLAAFTHHVDGSVATVQVGGFQWSRDVDPWGLGRTTSIRVADGEGEVIYDSGAFLYDGGGNIYSVGGDAYAYDSAGRLIDSKTWQAQDPGAATSQSFEYDRFGNLLKIDTNGDSFLLPVDGATNRLAGAGFSYDAFGNLVSGVGSLALVYDATDAATEVAGTGVNRQNYYDAGGERLVVEDLLAGSSQWTLRDLDNQVIRVLREVREADSARWEWQKDYVHGEAALVSIVPGGDGLDEDERVLVLHLNYLGTPTVVTEGERVVAYRKYLPFGLEMSQSGLDEVIQFTGHERDENAESPGGEARSDDLDYMHARYFAPDLGRLLSVDSVLGSAPQPQRWNRYSYVSNSPLAKVDPDGRAEQVQYFDVEVKSGKVFRLPPAQLANDIRLARTGFPTHYVFVPDHIVNDRAAAMGVELPKGRAGNTMRGQMAKEIVMGSNAAEGTSVVDGDLRRPDIRVRVGRTTATGVEVAVAAKEIRPPGASLAATARTGALAVLRVAGPVADAAFFMTVAYEAVENVDYAGPGFGDRTIQLLRENVVVSDDLPTAFRVCLASCHAESSEPIVPSPVQPLAAH